MTHYQYTDSSFSSILNISSYIHLHASKPRHEIRGKGVRTNECLVHQKNTQFQIWNCPHQTGLWGYWATVPFSNDFSPPVLRLHPSKEETLVQMLSNGWWWIATSTTRTGRLLVTKNLSSLFHLVAFPCRYNSWFSRKEQTEHYLAIANWFRFVVRSLKSPCNSTYRRAWGRSRCSRGRGWGNSSKWRLRREGFLVRWSSTPFSSWHSCSDSYLCWRQWIRSRERRDALL